MSNYYEPDDGPEGYVTEDRAAEFFVGGLQAMREMLARFVENLPTPPGYRVANEPQGK